MISGTVSQSKTPGRHLSRLFGLWEQNHRYSRSLISTQLAKKWPPFACIKELIFLKIGSADYFSDFKIGFSMEHSAGNN